MAALRTLLFATCALGALSGSALAASDDWGEGIEVIDDADMDDLRGGFTVGGIEIGFGAVVTSTLNGVPVLTTQITVTDTGEVVEEILNIVGQNLADLTPEELAALGLEGVDGAAGVIVASESGVTAFVHNMANGSLQNILVNTATGQDIAQDIDVTLTLPGFEYIQSQLSLEQFGMRLSDDLQNVAIGPRG
jgi:hypothetical protein